MLRLVLETPFLRPQRARLRPHERRDVRVLHGAQGGRSSARAAPAGRLYGSR